MGKGKKNKNKSNFIILIITLAVIAIIFLIIYYKNSNSLSEEEVKCIAEKTELYVLKTCSHCAEQKRILGNYLQYFKIIQCSNEMQKCRENDITNVPTWRMNNTNYVGIESLKNLKQLANC